jgi:hypothetical protein
MPRAFLTAWVALVAVGCNTPVSPPVVVTVRATLAAGNFTLKLDPGTAVSGSGNLCITNGVQSPNTSTSIPVVLSQNGTAWSARPTSDADRGLVVTLSQASSEFTGTATGAAFDGTKTVTFGRTEAPVESVQLSGPTLSASVISGYTSGRVDFSSPGGTSACTSYQWVLVPR